MQARLIGRYLLAAVLLIASYVAMDAGTRALAQSPYGVVPWYPAAGMGLMALLLVGPSLTPALVAARLLSTMWLAPIPGERWMTVASAIGVASAYGLAAALMRRRLLREGTPWRLSHVVWCCIIALEAALAAAFMGSFEQFVTGRTSRDHLLGFVARFWLGDAVGVMMLLGAAIILLPYAERTRAVRLPATGRDWRSRISPASGTALATPRVRFVERLWQGLALAVAIWMVTVGGDGESYKYLAFVPVAWIALRDGLRGAAVVVPVLGLGIAAMSVQIGLDGDTMLQLQVFLLVLAISALLLGAAVTTYVAEEGRYWHLIATTREGILRLDADARIIHVNERMATMLGRSPVELRGRPVIELVAPEDRAEAQERFARRAAGEETTFTVHFERADGTSVPTLVHGTPIRRRGDATVIGSLSLVTDLSELHALESSRRRSEELLSAAFRTSRDAMLLFRASDDVVVDVNDVWCRSTGLGREHAIGHRHRELAIWLDDTGTERLAEAIAEHGAVRDLYVDFRRFLPDGGAEVRRAVLSAYPAEAGGETFYFVSGRDVTEAWRAQSQERQQRKLEELGRLAGGIAHDFNNVLGVIASYGQLVEGQARDGQVPAVADVQEITRATSRGSALTRRLLAFSRHQVIEPRAIDLSHVVRDTEGLLRPLFGERTQLRFELAPDLPPVLADPSQVEQVVLNLAVNARDAMARGGRFTLATRRISVPAGRAADLLGPDAVAGDYVVLEATDTGVGMDEATRERMFEPFFTTKEPGKGTGLGLAVVYGIVRQAGGAVRVESALGKGTTFSLFWPTAGSPAPSATPEVPAAPAEAAGESRPSLPITRAESGRATVLLVDDEESVRTALRRALARAEFDVVEAFDGEDALAHLGRMPRAPDVVLTDITMPRMNGRELAEHLLREHPSVPVLMMTGYTQMRDLREGLANVRAAVIEKPFEVREVVEAVREAVRGERVAGGG